MININAGSEFQNKQIAFSKGSYITVEDKRVPEQFYIIIKGKVSISRVSLAAIQDKKYELGPGDFFGIISAMSGHSQIETALALTDIIVMPIRQDHFTNFIQADIPMANKILLDFSKLMRNLNEILSELTFKTSTTVNPRHLFSVAEYYTSQKQFDIAMSVYRKYIEYFADDGNVNLAKQYMEKIAAFVKTDLQYKKINDLARIYPKNSMIFCEGEPGDELFIIKSGMVKISKVVDNKEILLAVLSKGDIFGEMAIIESKPRGATAIAYEDSQILAVNNKNFDQLIKTQASLISHLTSLLAIRIWVIYKMITNTQITDPLGRMLDMLFIQLEKKRVNMNVTKKFVFDFGPKELINMVGLTLADGSVVIQKLLKNKYMGLEQDKIAINDMFEFFKQANFHRPKR